MRTLTLLAVFSAVLMLPAATAQTWEPMGPEGGSFSGVVVDPANADNLTIVGGYPSPADVYSSTNGGASWNIIGNVPNVYFAGAFAYNGMNDIYLAGYDNSFVYYCWYSNDGGVTWNTGTGFTMSPGGLLVDVATPTTIHMCGYVYDYTTYSYIPQYGLSTDGGATWTETALPTPPHDYPYVMGMAQAPTNANVMYITGYQYDLGNGYYVPLMYKTTDGGTRWTDISTNVGGDKEEVWALAIDPTNENIIHGGGWYYQAKSIDGGVTWTHHPDEMPGIGTVVIDSQNTNNVWMTDGSKFYKSADSGATWTTVTGGIGGSVGNVVQAPSAPSTLYMACTYGGLFKSLDKGDNWVGAHNGIMAASVTCMETAPSEPNTLYGSTLGSQMLITNDGCESINEGTYPPACTVGNFSDILVSSTDPDVVMGLAVG